uniref:Uncharacterized protein n=1 Tax=Neolamprologus brichardi TaxID=32507 RepID=A0A3Q4H924_NEOBR
VYFPCHSFSLPFPLFIFHSLILQAELNTRHPPPLTCRNFEHLLMCEEKTSYLYYYSCTLYYHKLSY